ncbi:tubulin binding cofactor A [Naematelia encephala]|uniref:Tubulin-specific chaperone A n=1 Tax=Naematelia encephala TaxID=71784 RepID=A0A1Y2B9C5_9TREE|nr:tubulin binding cofactor A [Naematelia encephala]
MSSSSAQTLRQLTIKTGVVKRLYKEEGSYIAEVKEAEERLNRLKAAGADGADIRNAERVVKDTEQMVPRTRKSLQEALQALEDLVAGLASEAEVTGSKEYETAVAVVNEVQAAGVANGV